MFGSSVPGVRGRVRALWLASVVGAVVFAAAGCATGDADPGRIPTASAPTSGPAEPITEGGASAWPGALYDAQHSSGTGAIGPQTGSVAWSTDLGGTLAQGPVIGVDGSVIAGGNDGVLHAVDPATGHVRWEFDGRGSTATDLSTSAAVLEDGTLLWPGPNRTVFALDSTGHELWTERLSAQVLSPAVGADGRVYVADMSGTLLAIDVQGAEHEVAWRTSVGGTNYASPAIGTNGDVYVSDGRHLVAVEDLGTSSRVAWRFSVRKLIEVSPAVAPDGTIVIGTNNDREYGVHPDGTEAWAFRIHDYTYSSAVVRPDGIGAFADNSGRVRVFDAGTGRVIRTMAPAAPGKEHVWTSVVIDAAGNTYWASTTGHLYGYDERGEHLFTTEVEDEVWSYPALGADGTLYLGTTAGRLLAVRG